MRCLVNPFKKFTIANVSKKLNEINVFLNETHQEVLRQMEPEQRHTMMTNLELLKASMESIKELMV